MEFTRNEGKVTEKGTIKLFNPNEGYGFIVDNKERDVFFHRNYLRGYQKEPEAGDQVIFEKQIGPKGFRATWLSFVEEQDVYRVLYKRNHYDRNYIVFLTGTVDEIKYPTEKFEQIKFQIKTNYGWKECSDPCLEIESA